MNRIVLIGNGFDIAHGLPTRYKNFIYWYWDDIFNRLNNSNNKIYNDTICTIELNHSYSWCKFLRNISNSEDFYDYTQNHNNIINIKLSPFFQNICKDIETKGWVDIENIYYTHLNYSFKKQDETIKLNEELEFIKSKLIEYLTTIQIDENIRCDVIQKKILEPFNPEDIIISDRDYIEEHYNYWIQQETIELIHKLRLYEKVDISTRFDIDDFKKNHQTFKSQRFNPLLNDIFRELYLIPDNILLLNFNYTKTAELYKKQFIINYIHGTLDNSQNVIFGYGDEIDKNYQTLRDSNDNEYLKNIKSIKYLEANNYRNLLSFIESAPYQIYIMGHSCGNSDRTLLNTLFEHQNCISIKPFYHKREDGTDNYLEIVQNISRNFTDMKLMRNRVVNKTYCEPLPQK